MWFSIIKISSQFMRPSGNKIKMERLEQIKVSFLHFSLFLFFCLFRFSLTNKWNSTTTQKQSHSTPASWMFVLTTATFESRDPRLTSISASMISLYRTQKNSLNNSLKNLKGIFKLRQLCCLQLHQNKYSFLVISFRLLKKSWCEGSKQLNNKVKEIRSFLCLRK